MNGFLPFKSLATTSTTTGATDVSGETATTLLSTQTNHALGLLGKFSNPNKNGDSNSGNEHVDEELEETSRNTNTSDSDELKQDPTEVILSTKGGKKEDKCYDSSNPVDHSIDTTDEISVTFNNETDNSRLTTEFEPVDDLNKDKQLTTGVHPKDEAKEHPETSDEKSTQQTKVKSDEVINRDPPTSTLLIDSPPTVSERKWEPIEDPIEDPIEGDSDSLESQVIKVASAVENFTLETASVSPPIALKDDVSEQIANSSEQKEKASPIAIPSSSSHFPDIMDASASPALQELAIPNPSTPFEPSETAELCKVRSVERIKPSVSIDAKEQYQQSHHPFDFQNFLNQLRKKSADPIVRYIRLFLVNMSRQGHTLTASQRIKTVVDFKQFINEKFTIFEPFALMDDRDKENSREGLEKLIMNRLYEHCFPPEVVQFHQLQIIPRQFEEDLAADGRILSQLEKYSWVNLVHLEVDLSSTTDSVAFTELAVEEINKINRYRAPRDKIICILNACKIIFSFLKSAKQELNADSFIPLLILVIIEAKTPHLISNIHYIENYRSAEWLHHGETLYYLLSLQAAIAFVDNLKAADLNIDDKEYEAHMEAWEAEQRQKIVHPVAKPVPAPENRALIAPGNVLFTSTEMLSKGISSFLSPSPPPQEQISTPELQQMRPMPVDGPLPPLTHEQQSTALSTEQVNASVASLSEMFPSMDAVILTDLVHLNHGNLEACIDQCLTMVNET